MGRLFEEHIKRKVKSLDGAWKFRTDEADCGKEEKWYLGFTGGETVIVPSVWNLQSKLITYEGVAWYEKTFYSEGGDLRMCFGAVMTEADVWLDGEYLGNHYGGFSQFEFIVPGVASGMHHLTVRVDNRFDEQSIPQARLDWYHYGGIIRSVTMETLEGVCILNHRLEYTLAEDLKSARCKFVVDLYHHEKGSAKLQILLGDQQIYSEEIAVEGTQTLELPEFTLEDVKLWDVGKPNLYPISIFTDTDDLQDRVGFRKIAAEHEKILLNGRQLEIRGVNRHEEHPDFGFAFPMGLMKKDIELVLQMGCNAIRGSHYPNSREFVDFLDERGILFWSEIPIWGVGFPERVIGDPVVVERGMNMHREMVKYYYNHPCIIMWGMHNETPSHSQEVYRMSEKYYHFLKENGGNRLVVYASNVNVKDICFEFTDVICLNEYWGWYGGDLNCWKPFLDKFIEHRNQLGLGEKPIIFSEFGAAAVYGTHDDEEIVWSEEYQARLISLCLRLFHETPSVAGSFIWQFCDLRTCLEAGINRARGFNNKGLLNEYRKPKMAYHAAKKLYWEFAEEEQ
ncbi:MAG: beta-glucuronidase [Firmicutes bacterium]|nr:beta-glucuronidase [Bacillota bacterium]